MLTLIGVIVSPWHASSAENIDPDADGSQYAWSENGGWLNLQPLGPGGSGVQVDNGGLSGWMWGENIGWVSLNCTNTSSCGTVNYAVTNDGLGTLAGYAWSENAGWISFSCDNTASCGTGAYGVTIDPVSGLFAGDAWSENIGWIRFASNGANPFTIRTGWSCLAPAGQLTLGADKAGSDLQLTWGIVGGATAYDVLQGDLDALRGSAGDFATATTVCAADDLGATTTLISGDPPAGSGFWWLIRAVGCDTASYDAGTGSQVASRDAGIDAAPAACP